MCHQGEGTQGAEHPGCAPAHVVGVVVVLVVVVGLVAVVDVVDVAVVVVAAAVVGDVAEGGEGGEGGRGARASWHEKPSTYTLSNSVKITFERILFQILQMSRLKKSCFHD